jgi:hypothetical protein
MNSVCIKQQNKRYYSDETVVFYAKYGSYYGFNILNIMLYLFISDDFWARVCSCLSSVLSVSRRSRLYGVHRGLPKVLLVSLQGVRDHLSVLGKPVETIKNANHVCIFKLHFVSETHTHHVPEGVGRRDITDIPPRDPHFTKMLRELLQM